MSWLLAFWKLCCLAFKSLITLFAQSHTVTSISSWGKSVMHCWKLRFASSSLCHAVSFVKRPINSHTRLSYSGRHWTGAENHLKPCFGCAEAMFGLSRVLSVLPYFWGCQDVLKIHIVCVRGTTRSLGLCLQANSLVTKMLQGLWPLSNHSLTQPLQGSVLLGF